MPITEIAGITTSTSTRTSPPRAGAGCGTRTRDVVHRNAVVERNLARDFGGARAVGRGPLAHELARGFARRDRRRMPALRPRRQRRDEHHDR